MNVKLKWTNPRSSVECVSALSLPFRYTSKQMQEIPGYLESFVATGQLMEKLLIERVAFFSNACGHENVTSDELMNNLAVGGHAAKGNVDVALKLDGHLGD